MTCEQSPEIIVAEIAKNSREVIRVSLGEFKGAPTIGVWRFYRDGGGNLRPGKGGLIVGLGHLPALAAALAQALDMARQTGRLPAE